MPDSVARVGFMDQRTLSIAALLALAAGYYGFVQYTQTQNDRIATEAKARADTQSQLNSVERSIAAMSTRLDTVGSMQGQVSTVVASTARLEASLGPLANQVRDIELRFIETRSAVAGHQKDIDSIRADIQTMKADIARSNEGVRAALNQLRDFIFRPQRQGGNDMAGPGDYEYAPPALERSERTQAALYCSATTPQLLLISISFGCDIVSHYGKVKL